MRRIISGLLLVFLVSSAMVFAQDRSEPDLPISEDVTYVVQPADTLDVIGAIFDVSPTCISEQNGIDDPAAIAVGTELTISVTCPTYGGDPRDKGVLEVLIPREVVEFEDDCEGYRVQINDNIDTIAFGLDISAVSLALANELEPPYVLDINQCLTIPEDAPPYGVFPAVRTASGNPGAGGGADIGEQYVVQPGDTLETIALALNVSRVAIQEANGIDEPNDILPGTALLIPADAPPYGVFPAVRTASGNPGAGGGADIGEQYVVQPGDTLDTIAQALNVSIISLQRANDLDNPRALLPGTALLISADAPPYGVFPADSRLRSGSGQLYVVDAGDTVESVAEAFDVAVAALRAANDLADDEAIFDGDVIVVPYNVPPFGADEEFDPSMLLGQGGGGAVHVVQPRETVDGIAAYYNLDRQCLLDANGIERGYLVQPGTEILLDSSCPPYVGFGSPAVNTDALGN